jgi:predicted small integral membrane protein
MVLWTDTLETPVSGDNGMDQGIFLDLVWVLFECSGNSIVSAHTLVDVSSCHQQIWFHTLITQLWNTVCWVKANQILQRKFTNKFYGLFLLLKFSTRNARCSIVSHHSWTQTQRIPRVGQSQEQQCNDLRKWIVHLLHGSRLDESLHADCQLAKFLLKQNASNCWMDLEWNPMVYFCTVKWILVGFSIQYAITVGNVRITFHIKILMIITDRVYINIYTSTSRQHNNKNGLS